MAEPPLPIPHVGDRVAKTEGDYTFEGVVVSRFWKRNGIVRRFVVEDDRGLLFIFNADQLRPVEEEEEPDA